MDSVTMIRHAEGHWRVWVSGQEQPLTLTPEEQQAVAYHVRRHSDKTAYAQTYPRPQAG